MAPDERNQIIHEAMGKCWHEYEQGYSNLHERSCWKCVKCSEEVFWIHSAYSGKPDNPDYSKWQHYGPMLEWAMKQEWWDDFAYEGDGNWNYMGYETYIFKECLLNPLKGAAAIAEFLKKRERDRFIQILW